MFIQANHAEVLDHMHETMAEQLSDQPCHLHPAALICEAKQDCNLLVMGTPCNPFSTQRAKRFGADSVMQHKLVAHTFDEPVKVLRKWQPINVVMEQAEGFMKPFEAAGLAGAETTTPLERPVAGNACVPFHAESFFDSKIESEQAMPRVKKVDEGSRMAANDGPSPAQ